MLGFGKSAPMQRHCRDRRSQQLGHVARGATAVCLALVLGGCASRTTSTATASQLFKDYVNSTNVEGDKYRGSTSADRIAEFSSEGTPSEVEANLLAAHQCSQAAAGGCAPDQQAATVLESLAASSGSTYRRQILVEHSDHRLALITLYVACKQQGACELVDATGRSYSSLDGFRRHNSLLTSSDQMLTPSDPTAVSGDGDAIVVSGHTASRGAPWLIIVLSAVAVFILAGCILLLRRRNASLAESTGL